MKWDASCIFYDDLFLRDDKSFGKTNNNMSPREIISQTYEFNGIVFFWYAVDVQFVKPDGERCSWLFMAG